MHFKSNQKRYDLLSVYLKVLKQTRIRKSVINMNIMQIAPSISNGTSITLFCSSFLLDLKVENIKRAKLAIIIISKNCMS